MGASIISIIGGIGKQVLRDWPVSRAGLGLPRQFDWGTELPVQARDINYGGHLGHDAAVSLLHEARRRWLARAGYDEADAGGAGLIMLELEVHYTAEAFWADRLRVAMAVTGLGAVRCEFRYRVSRAGQEVLIARTRMGFFDYKARRLARRPSDFLQRLLGLAEEGNDV
ncbi:acyl-CoA thioesterase [Immundisolibacter sp.]|uniref:acyl-CoA thioesterase n=1 Tax=Immundisolibacter sp. TaxID=1934948 RepID=UPI003F505DBA